MVTPPLTTQSPGTPPPATAAPGPLAAPPAGPADELPGVARFRAMLGAQTGLAYRSAAPLDPATGSVRLTGAVLSRGESRMAMEELTLDGLAADPQGDQRIAAASAREVTLSAPGSRTARAARLELRGLAAPQAGAGALVLDQLRLETLTVEGDEPVAIAEILLEDYAAGRPGRVTVTGIDVLLPQAGSLDRVRVGRVALRGLDLPAMIAAMEAQTAPPRTTGGYALEVEEVAVMLGTTAVAGLGALRLQGDPPAGDIESGRIALRELRLEPSPGIEDWLRRLGYPALVADLTGESRYDRSSGRLEIGSLSLAGQEMGVLGLSLVLDGVTPEAAEAQAWEEIRLAGLTLRYLDRSLYARAVRDQARRLRLPEARVREQWASQAATAIGAGAGAPPGGPASRPPAAPRGAPTGPSQATPAPTLAPVVAALQRFLRGEAREVEVTLAPPQPLPLGQLPLALMGGPAALQRMLGLGAVAR